MCGGTMQKMEWRWFSSHVFECMAFSRYGGLCGKHVVPNPNTIRSGRESIAGFVAQSVTYFTEAKKFSPSLGSNTCGSTIIQRNLAAVTAIDSRGRYFQSPGGSFYWVPFAWRDGRRSRSM